MVGWCSETGRESLTSGLALALCCAIVSEKMSKLFQDVKVADGRRIDATKAALLDWLIAEKQMLQTQLKVWRGDFCEQRRLICVDLACFDGCFGMWRNKQLTEQAITSVKYMDRERDTTEWVSENQFLVRLDGHVEVCGMQYLFFTLVCMNEGLLAHRSMPKVPRCLTCCHRSKTRSP